MKLTKFQHSCFTVEKDGVSLVVDPGEFSHDFIMPPRVAGVFISHGHSDHLDEAVVHHILQKHPKAVLIGHETIVGKFTTYATIAPKLGDTYTVGPFSLRFFGGAHASIVDTLPPLPNLGIFIDGRLYYPGDSFALPEGVAVQELALPLSAPWLKISDATTFLARVHPQFAFPVHDAILSNDGKTVFDRLVGIVAAQQDILYQRLDSATIELTR